MPHKQAERILDESGVQENFQYFMRVRLERLAFFQKWLERNFKVEATINGDGIIAVNQWVEGYGGALVPDIVDYLNVFASYQPRWEGNYIGFNIMIDIGIFLGEYLSSKRAQLYWDIYRGHEVEPATYKSAGYLRPHLAGMPRGWGCDVLTAGCGFIEGSRCGSIIGHDVLATRGNALIGFAKEKLYFSRLPDGNDPIIIGDSKDEPL